MNTTPRSRKLLASVLAGVGITVGAAGIANAVSSPASTTPPAVSPAASSGAPADGEVEDAGTTDVNEVGETPDANEASETADGNEAADANEPTYTASITAPQASGSEADENSTLAPLATITAAEATKAAVTAVPGTAGAATLENENGNVVYGVTITTPSGSIDVKVDAGNGKILAQDSGDEPGNGDD